MSTTRTRGAGRILSFTRDGLEFDVIDTGPLDGEAVVLLHGWPQTATSWAEVGRQLNERGYRTFAPNQRGYAAKARPAALRAYQMPELVGDVHALVGEIARGPVHLVGHDWGSAVAWSLATAHPEDVRTLTSLAVPHPLAFLRAMLVGDQLSRSWYMGFFQIPKLPEAFAARHRERFGALLMRSGMTRDEIQSVYDEILDSGALGTSLNWYRAMRFVAPLSGATKVRAPTLHVWSDGDVALSRKSAELAGDYVTGPYRLHVMRGANHWFPTQRADETASLILEHLASSR